jgi:hypothetical protein
MTETTNIIVIDRSTTTLPDSFEQRANDFLGAFQECTKLCGLGRRWDTNTRFATLIGDSGLETDSGRHGEEDWFLGADPTRKVQFGIQHDI